MQSVLIACLWIIQNSKAYQESNKTLKDVNEIIVQTSNDTGTCYGVAKYTKFVFERGKMMKGEIFKMLNERMRTIDPDENEIYKF